MSCAVQALITIRLREQPGQWVSVAELARYMALPEAEVSHALLAYRQPIGLTIDKATELPTAAMQPLTSDEVLPCA